MRPIKLGPYSPITLNNTLFNAQGFTSASGVATAPTTTATTDGLAHLVNLVGATASLAGISFTIIGTDANGMAQTETGLVGPGIGATVTSTKHFKTVTSLTPSGSMGTGTVSIGIAAESVTPMIPLEWRSVAAAAMTVQVTGTINFTVEETYANPFTNAHADCPWVSVTALASKIATTSSTVTVGDQAVRLKTNSVTNGATLTWFITQAAGYTM
jgi:hypothetical protein